MLGLTFTGGRGSLTFRGAAVLDVESHLLELTKLDHSDGVLKGSIIRSLRLFDSVFNVQGV